MRTRRPGTFSISTLGCRVNHYEAEQLAALLRARGWEQVPPGQAELRVVHTCSVTTEAAAKSRQTVRRATRLPVLSGPGGPPCPGSADATCTTAAGSAGCGPASLPTGPRGGIGPRGERADAGEPTAAPPTVQVSDSSPHPDDPASACDSLEPDALTSDSRTGDGRRGPPAPRPGAGHPPRRSRVVVTGCWATSNGPDARNVQGVDAVLGHHQDVAQELSDLLDQWDAEEPSLTSPPDTPADRQRPLTRISDATPQSGESASAEPGDDGWMMRKAGAPRSLTASQYSQARWPKRVKGKLENDETGAQKQTSGSENRSRATRPGMVSLPLLGQRQTGHQRAFLKVQDGCDAHCTYCIIPRLRPGIWSKPVSDAVEEARRLVDAGHVELVLTGIFLGAYGQDSALRRRRDNAPFLESPVETPGRARFNGREPPPLKIAPPDRADPTAPQSLCDLVNALCSTVPGLQRLRLSSLEPGDLTDDLVTVLRSHPQVVPHLHLPLQSGSERILRRMNRQYGRDDYLRMIDRVRAAFDRPAITTDIIVGFPGETEAEFGQTVDVVRRVGFLHVHAFPYSPRPGTAAARWTREFVRGPVVNQRIDRLRTLAAESSLAFRQQFLNEVVEVLAERPSGDEEGMSTLAGFRHGRCERYFPVWFAADGAARAAHPTKPGQSAAHRSAAPDDGSEAGTPPALDLNPNPLPSGARVRLRIDQVTPQRTFGTILEVSP